jgi:PAS domain S-box-containing protein
VLVAAYLGGFGPGFFALILSAIAGHFFFEQPYFAFGFAKLEAIPRLELFLLSGGTICLLAGALNRTMVRVREQTEEIQQTVGRLRQSEARYRRVLEAAYKCIWTLDSNGTTNFISARTAEMLGYSWNEVLGRSLTDFCFEEDREQLQAAIADRKHGGQGAFDFRFRRWDGSALWCMVVTQPIFDSQGQYVGCLTMLADAASRDLSSIRLPPHLQSLELSAEKLHGVLTALDERSATASIDNAEPAADGQASDWQANVTRARSLAEQMLRQLKSSSAADVSLN